MREMTKCGVKNEKIVEEHGGRRCLATPSFCSTGTFAKPACSAPAHTSANRVFRRRIRWRSKNIEQLIRYQCEEILRYHLKLSKKSAVFPLDGLAS